MFKNFKSNYYKEHRSEYLHFLYFPEGTIFTIMNIIIKYIMHVLRTSKQSLNKYMLPPPPLKFAASYTQH